MRISIEGKLVLGLGQHNLRGLSDGKVTPFPHVIFPDSDILFQGCDFP